MTQGPVAEEAGPPWERALLEPWRGQRRGVGVGVGGGGPGAYGAGPGRAGGGPGLLAAVGGPSRRAGAGAEARAVPCGRAAGLEPAAPRSQLARRRLSGLWSSRCLCSEHRRSRRSLPPARRRSRAPSARAARMRLPGLGLGLGLEREEAEERRRRAACDGELLLDAVLRAPPQGSGAAAARRRVSPGGSRRCARGPGGWRRPRGVGRVVVAEAGVGGLPGKELVGGGRAWAGAGARTAPGA